jgi:hypothetical protein
MKTSLSACVVGVAVLVGGFGALAERAEAQQRGRSDQPLPKGVVLEKIPEGAVEVRELVKSAQVGQRVVVHGRIASVESAVSREAPVLELSDDAAVADCCPKDGSLMTVCPIPAEKRVRIELVDERGRALRGGLAGKGGLRPGAEVFALGEIAGVSPTVIRATGLHVPRESLPAGLFAGEEPVGARDVSEARKSGELKKGDTVVLRGRIGGSVQPFVPERAVFTLVGRGIPPCNENPGDKCRTPWDYCCETRADITANSATVRVSDGKGNPLRTDIKGRAGIKELSEMVVVGKVAVVERGALIVDAISVHVANP